MFFPSEPLLNVLFPCFGFIFLFLKNAAHDWWCLLGYPGKWFVCVLGPAAGVSVAHTSGTWSDWMCLGEALFIMPTLYSLPAKCFLGHLSLCDWSGSARKWLRWGGLVEPTLEDWEWLWYLQTQSRFPGEDDVECGQISHLLFSICQMWLLPPFLPASACMRCDEYMGLYFACTNIVTLHTLYQYKESILGHMVLTGDLPVCHNLNYFKSWLSPDVYMLFYFS